MANDLDRSQPDTMPALSDEMHTASPEGRSRRASVSDIRSRNPEEARTQELIQTAYDYGEAYQRPPLSEETGEVGDYIRDKKPADFDNQCLVRESSSPIHTAVLKCSVQGSFIDQSVFTDTNVLLEILQNAEPRDSKGTWFDIEFYADGQWRSVAEEIGVFSDQQIEAVRIVDNGKGYLPTDMTTIGGGKRNDPESAGRFGTGMKVSDRSALGKGVQVTRYSRNWRAKPFLEPVLTSAGHDYTVSYTVEFFEGCRDGSIVEYRDLTPEMMAALRRIQDIYLPLDKNAKERLLARNIFGLILNPKNGQGDVKVFGRSYELTVAPAQSLLFSYDLHDCPIDDQNRHYADTSRVTENIRRIWAHVDNPALFRQLLEAANEDTSRYEHNMPGSHEVPDAFKQAAREVYKIEDFDKAYINDSETTDEDRKILKRQGYQGVKIGRSGKSKFITETFAEVGVLTGRNLIEKITSFHAFHSEKLDNYKDENFASCACRAITGMDKYERGKEIMVVVVDSGTRQEAEIPYAQFIKEKEQQHTPVRLVVRVKGIQVQTNNTWGGWTEEFSTFSASCVAAGVQASIYNGHYELNPHKKWNDTPAVHIRHWEKSQPRDLEVHIYIENLNQAAELRKLHKYSLNLNPDYQPVVSTPYGDIVALGGGSIYEQGIRKNNFKGANRILSYNIPTKVTDENIASHVSHILQAAENIEVPKAILRKAKEEGKETEFLEYSVKNLSAAGRALWKQAFEEVFGENTVVDNCVGRTHHGTSDPFRRRVLDIEESSGIQTVRLHEKLVDTLVSCGVKRLSEAVTAHKAEEYQPNPIEEALLLIKKVADRAIKENLPEGRGVIKTEVKLARSVSNSYGQKLRTGPGYLGPSANDTTIYVFDEVATNRKIAQLITFILNKKIEVYSSRLGHERYVDFKAAVLTTAERTLSNIEFIRKVRGMMFNRPKRITALVEKTIQRMEAAEAEEEISAVEVQKPEEEKKPKKRFFSPKTVSGIAAATALMALLIVYGDRINPSGIMGKARDAIARIMPDLGGGAENPVSKIFKFFDNLIPDSDDSYQRPHVPDSSPIGVGIERSRASTGDSPADYLKHQKSTFISNPPLAWGRFMTEKSMAKYNGKGWEYDPDAPDFANPNFPEVQRTAHYQKVKGGSSVALRTMAGGYIDPTSIKLLKEDGSEITNFKTTYIGNGEYQVNVAEDAVALIYHTAMAVNWQNTAEGLTDGDFASLPAGPYAYYTAVPDLDLSKIRFQSPLYPQYKSLAEFINYVKTLKPFKRIKVLRAVVEKMRYTRTEKTETAYNSFHAGRLPEKDFLEFILNSTELDQPGDGDCDAQNSTYALLARLAGIPTKLDSVFTEKGIGHGPAVTFLPKIGWVLTDTMGERIMTERIVYGGNGFADGKATTATQEEINKALLKVMKARAEYEGGQCPALWEKGHPAGLNF